MEKNIKLYFRGRGGRKVFPITGTNSETRRGRVGKGVANTITTSCNQAVIEPKVIDDQGRIKDSYKQHDVVPTLRAQTHGNPPKVTVIEDFYKNREPRFYEEESPTLGSDRIGLKVLLDDQQYVDGISDKHSFAKKKAQAMLNKNGELPERFNPYNEQEIDEVAIMRPKRTDYGKQIRKQYESGEIEESRHNMTTLEPVFDGISNTITTVQKDNLLLDNRQCMRIRKLTPKECWRLQGVPDHYFDKASAVNSDSQLYKQAGNACTVNVIFEVARRIGREETACTTNAELFGG